MSVALSIDLSKKKTILCFGEALIDMLAQPPVKKGMPRAFLQCAGGAPANVAVAVARLGGAVQFVGMLGSDMFGDFLFDSFAEAGVVTDGIVRTSTAKTALAFVALDAHGERSFSFYRPPAADLLFGVEHFQDASFSDALIFHACSNSMTDADIAEVTFEGMRRAQAAGAIVSFDLNFRPMLWPNGENPASRLWKGLSLADVVKLSSEELDYLANTLAADANAVIQSNYGRAGRSCCWLLMPLVRYIGTRVPRGKYRHSVSRYKTVMQRVMLSLEACCTRLHSSLMMPPR